MEDTGAAGNRDGADSQFCIDYAGAGLPGDSGSTGKVPQVASEDDGCVEAALGDPREIDGCRSDHSYPKHLCDEAAEYLEPNGVLSCGFSVGLAAQEERPAILTTGVRINIHASTDSGQYRRP